MTGFEMPTVKPFEPPMCVCGHPIGDHASSRSTFPHPVRYGICFAGSCDCREFVERDPEPPEAA